jgi:phytoene/squalene synthetase
MEKPNYRSKKHFTEVANSTSLNHGIWLMLHEPTHKQQVLDYLLSDTYTRRGSDFKHVYELIEAIRDDISFENLSDEAHDLGVYLLSLDTLPYKIN